MKCNIREVSGNSKSTNFHIYFGYNKGLCGDLPRFPTAESEGLVRGKRGIVDDLAIACASADPALLIVSCLRHRAGTTSAFRR